MNNFLLDFLNAFIKFNNIVFSPLDTLVKRFGLPYWIQDALIDSLHMLPFLFFIFILIELIEYFYADKMKLFVEHSKNTGPLIGSLAASVPQCGFSVIASTLYTKRLITKGTLLAVFLSTSDEAVPVLLTAPDKAHAVLQILAVKIFIAVFAGYLIDVLFNKTQKNERKEDENADEEGCCHHHVEKPSKRDLIIHPLIHTANVYIFILAVTLIINYFVMKIGGEGNLSNYLLNDSIFQPVLTAIFGLIPNCAISVAITMMYIKGAIGFGSCVSGLCSSAGLGILVLFKKNTDLKDTLNVVFLLLAISIFTGIILQTFYY